MNYQGNLVRSVVIIEYFVLQSQGLQNKQGSSGRVRFEPVLRNQNGLPNDEASYFMLQDLMQ